MNPSAHDPGLSVRRERMLLHLDPVQGCVTIRDGSASWLMTRGGASCATLTLRTPSHEAVTGLSDHQLVLGGEHGVAVRWRVDRNGVIGVGDVPQLRIAFRLTYRLAANRRLHCRIDISGAGTGNVQDIVFPASPVASGVQSCLVFPQWLGLLIPAEGPDLVVRRMIWQRPWSMRFIGGTQSTGDREHSYIAIIEDSLYRSVDIWRTNNALGFLYVGDASHAEQTTQRRSQTLDFQFVEGNYVDIAKRYRAWAKRLPVWRTLASRINPCDAGVVGGAIPFAHIPCDYGGDVVPFDALIPRLQALKAIGIDRAILHIGGWNRKGYDAEYPDVLPANPRCGGDAGMVRLTRAIRDAGYLCTPHDDLGIISTAARSYQEHWVARWADGSPINGGVYRDTQNYITTAAAQVHFAKRNTAAVRVRYPDLEGYLYDVTTSVQPLEDHSTNPPVTKERDLQGRAEAFEITRKAFARFIMGESIVDWSIQHNDAAFMAEEGYYHRGDGGWSTDALHGVIVPLWELVYHDVQIAVRESTTHVNTPMETTDPVVRYLRVFLKTLRAGTLPPAFFSDDLTGNVLRSYLQETTTPIGGWSVLSDTQLLATVSRISTWLADLVFHTPMVDHAFVSGDLYHERTTFDTRSAPTCVYINTSLDTWSPMQGVVLPGLGFYISGPGLLAYHALRVAGMAFSQPTLAVIRWKERHPRSVSAYRAFGDEAVIYVQRGKPMPVCVPDACRTMTVTPE